MKTTAKLDIGANAPKFELPDQTGQTHKLSDYKGKTVVLYFYPKDDTPGCTKQACEFRDTQASFKRKKAVVLGISPDAPKSHQKFVTKFDLNFPLLADEDKSVCNAYGVWKLKKFMGREYMGVERSTFVIGPDGKLKNILRKVKPEGHAQEMLGEI
jgi:peroxiredoxin Q/BCP